MSRDFFTSLIGRHSGTAQTVEPRIGSRYEDSRASGLPQFESFPGPADYDRSTAKTDPRTESEGSAASPVPLTRRRTATRPAVPLPDAEPVSNEPRNMLAASARTELPQPDSPKRSAPAAPAEPQAENDRTRRIESLLAHLKALARRPGALQPRDDGSAPGAFRQPRPGSSQESRANRRHGAADVVDQQRAVGESLRPERPPLEPARPAADFATPDWMTALRSKLSQRRSPPERGTEPVINVTIGRVEVKAVRETGQASPPRKNTLAIMSLDDYLARGQREGRT